jgi:Protein of unknown function (DUF2569)
VNSSTTKSESRRLGGWLWLALAGLAVFAAITAIEMRDSIKMMLEWELLAVFFRPGTHGWYRTVIALTGFDVATGALIVAGAGWLLLLAWRRSSRFPAHVQIWLLMVLAAQALVCLFGAYMTAAIGIGITIPVDGLVRAVAAAGLGIPYFGLSRRVRETFVSR